MSTRNRIVYVGPETPLYRGIKPGNVNRNSLVWFTRNANHAKTYGNVGVYYPKRRLRLLWLDQNTVERILKRNNVSQQLKNVLRVVWGMRGRTAIQEFENNTAAAGRLRSTVFALHGNFANVNNEWNPLAGRPNLFYSNKTRTTLRPSGRLSEYSTNLAAYKGLRKLFENNYDGFWSPWVKTPWHGSERTKSGNVIINKKFHREIVIFKPREVLGARRPLTNTEMNQVVRNTNARQTAALQLRRARAQRRIKN